MELFFNIFYKQNGVKCAPFFFVAFLLLTSCSLENPADKTEVSSEYAYCYWLLEKQYYFDDLPQKSAFTEVNNLYNALKDKYTRYIEPSNVESTEEAMTTSVNNGSIGIELASDTTEEYPLIVYRVYEGSPAYRANVMRYAKLLAINGVSLQNDTEGAVYNNEMSKANTVTILYTYNGDTITVSLTKEIIYAPTVFLDTLLTGNPIITLKKFAAKTFNKELGTYGELDSIVKILKNTKEKVIIDVRNNPGGLVSQCKAAADLFVKEGILFRIHANTIYKNGQKHTYWNTYEASEKSDFTPLDLLLFANENSASCAEIFITALKSTSVKSAGKTTFGKGIGQTSWKTPIGALTYITSLMVYDSNYKSYHGEGITPDYPCENANMNCLYEILNTNSIKAKRQGFVYKEPKKLLDTNYFGYAVFDLE